MKVHSANVCVHLNNNNLDNCVFLKNNQNRFLIRKSYLFRLINGRGGKNKKTLFQIILMLILFLKYIFIVKDPAFVKFFTKLLNFSPSSTKTLFTIYMCF